nr:ImmA/IrrE family metallo-endopeptidase [uncultured Rhodopila sp.]
MKCALRPEPTTPAKLNGFRLGYSAGANDRFSRRGAIGAKISGAAGAPPPIDVENILSEYANIEYVHFPVEIDGLCLDLKMIGKRPTVLVSKRIFELRRRFTLALELGHVLIPLHVGSIIYEIDSAGTADDNHFATEAEASRFASELLMPAKWVCGQIRSCKNPLDALFLVYSIAGNYSPPDFLHGGIMTGFPAKALAIAWSAVRPYKRPVAMTEAAAA